MRKTRPISRGLPKAASTSAGSMSASPAASPITTTISKSSAAAATTAPAETHEGPPANGASARPPR